MTTVSSTARAAGAFVRRETLLDRALAATPLLSSYVLLCLVYVWHSYGHGSPWLFTDELEYAQISRSIAETGRPALLGNPETDVSLYTYLLAPVWWLSDTQSAYTAAKYLGAFVMTSAIFPAYGLARLLVPRGPALFAAVATAAVPLLGYSRLITTEVLAYPFAALTFYVAAKALATWGRYWVAATVLLLLVAPAVRTQLEMLRPAVVLAAAIVLWLSPPARRFRQSWGTLQWAAAATGVAVLLHIGHKVAFRNELYYLATTLPDRMQQFAIWSFGAFLIGVGIFPVIVALASLWRPRDLDLPGYRALAGLLVGAVVCFGLYTVVKTVYLSTVFANVVTERNLVYLSPLVFAATALFIYRPGGNPLVFVGAGALVGYVIVHAPFALENYPYSDAPGLAVLATLNRELHLDDAAIERVLLSVAAGSVLLSVAALLGQGRTLAAKVALPVVAVAVLAWNLTGLISFGNGINDLGTRLRSSVPDPPNWVDNITGGRPTMYLGQSIADGNAVYLTEFWNRSITAVGTLDDQAIGPGPTLQIVPYARDGRVVNDPGVDYVVTNSLGIEPQGTLAYQTGDWRLYRVGRPLRLRSEMTGVYADGWTGSRATLSFFGSGEAGTLEVRVSREGWGGEDRPGTVAARVGDLIPAPLQVIANPCNRAGTCVDRNPRIGKLYGEGTWTAHAGQAHTFRFRVRTPFRLEIVTDPTFSPAEFGEGDVRQFGVQLATAFHPSQPG